MQQVIVQSSSLSSISRIEHFLFETRDDRQKYILCARTAREIVVESLQNVIVIRCEQNTPKTVCYSLRGIRQTTIAINF